MYTVNTQPNPGLITAFSLVRGASLTAALQRNYVRSTELVRREGRNGPAAEEAELSQPPELAPAPASLHATFRQGLFHERTEVVKTELDIGNGVDGPKHPRIGAREELGCSGRELLGRARRQLSYRLGRVRPGP